ncbi:restriction endonuclease [Bifidobacterium breve]|uniref:Restriction endonuclease n=1 Tax=Bifidobacterium breve TaxID=1685 RepID=A0AAN1M579_BIFBR|nr:restriction endonuclease [Bifidobacterium breve]AUD91145.1 restriction endonuclease [Bifidobacterium breve]AUE18575.1 restriction endonuclease [Bifidobacterium breve]MDG5962723.1 restriction endonuclease [Bifidobacterium breve]MDG5969173.1 restriction endonuclease [Bifidobacterium breve]
MVDAIYADSSQQARAMITGQVHRFGSVMQTGDDVVTYSPEERLYHIGSVTGGCIIEDTTGDDEHDSRYSRPVIWRTVASRDKLADTSKNSLGTIATLSQIGDDVFADLTAAAGTSDDSPSAPAQAADNETTDDDETRRITANEGIEKIKDRIVALSWEDMESLVAGLLRAMGYRTTLTSKGGDQGRDVIASPDGLGLTSPRIIVEVKHRGNPMGAPAVHSFIGGLHDSDKGLYVSTGGFTKEALYEAERARVPVTLLNLDQFARVFVDNYETTDLETSALLPLTRIYWPA